MRSSYYCTTQRNVDKLPRFSRCGPAPGRSRPKNRRGTRSDTMRASVLGTGHCLPARALVKVGRSGHFGRQPGRQPACMHCMHKNRLKFSDLSSDHACRILFGWLAGWRAASNQAQMGWKWSAGGKCMTPRARSEKISYGGSLNETGNTLSYAHFTEQG